MSQDLLARLQIAQIGACTCLTKTPDIAFHKQECRYRMLTEALSELERMTQLVAAGELVHVKHQWRKRAEDQPWHDATKEDAYQRVDEHYEARTISVIPPDHYTVTVRPVDIFSGGLYFRWGCDRFGFGELSIGLHDDGTVTCMNECMSREFVRKAAHAAVDALVDAAELEDKR